MRPLAALILAGVTLGGAAAARADGFYYTESFGATRIHDQLAGYTPGGLHVQLGIGARRGDWALEGILGGDLSDSTGGGAAAPDVTMGGLQLKYLRPIASHVEVYLRGSATYGAADGALDGYAGRGLGLGAGVQLKGKVSALGLLAWPLFFVPWGPKITGAIFLDDGYEFYRLRDRRGATVDAQLTHLSAGFALGTDF